MMCRTTWFSVTFIAVVALCAIAITGCQPPVNPNSQAVILVVSDVYSQLGQSSSFYIGGDAADDVTLGQAKAALEFGLQTSVLSPSDRITGEPGASVALGRFRVSDDGTARVVASFVNEQGTGRGCVEYTLERTGDVWSIQNATDVWPDCSIAAQGEGSYHATLARIRQGDCSRLGAQTGTCGSWLYVLESSGYDGTRSYFDWETGLIVAQEHFTDADEVDDLFTFGHVECEPVTTETIPCDLTDRLECEANGGVWEVWGRSAGPSCNQRTSDVGSPCTDSSECEGDCIAEIGPDASCAGATTGICSEFRTTFGCFCTVVDRGAVPICVD